MNDVISILEHYGIPFKRQGESPLVTSGWIGLICPFCGEGTDKYGLGVNLEWSSVNCWKCGGHSFAEILHTFTKESWNICIELAKGIRRNTVPKGLQPKGKLELPKGLGPLLPAHKKYLKGRGFDPDELVKLWNLRGIGLAAKLPWRIFFPINFRGETVSWTTRSLTDKGIRYIGATPGQEKIKAKNVGLGWEYVRHAVIVVEGPLDAVRVGPGSLATLGTSWSRSQLKLLSQVPTRVIVFDSDPTAQKRAKELCNALCGFPGRTYRVELDSPDPGSCTQKEVNLLRRSFL